ncbi:MAG: carbamoyltransferase [Acidobacteria bacterium]|nr:carbamoyltransferase [Acidobacteriota bacterium]
MPSQRILGLNRTQDASLCLVEDGRVSVHVQKERLTRRKHAWGRPGDVGRVYRTRVPEIAAPVDMVVECFSSDPQRAKLDEYRRELEEELTFREAPRILEVSHHLAHAYGAFHPSPFDEAAVMVVDFQGSPGGLVTETWPGPVVGEATSVEVASYYLGQASSSPSLRCLGKSFWSKARTSHGGLGYFYWALTQCLFPGAGREGIVMGLAPYGDPSALDLPALEVAKGGVTMPAAWIDVFRFPDRFRFFKDGRGSFRDCADLAAAGQKVFEEALIETARWLRRESGARNLVYTGGCALNCSANERLRREAGYEAVFLPPAPHDGGTAVGCALYGWFEVSGGRERWRWREDYLGPQPDFAQTVESLRSSPEVEVGEPADLAEVAAAALARGEIVALFQGRSESGPRALGHRSILADPRYAAVTAFINREIKERQWFRPLAPIVLAEAQGEYFALDVASPFMQLAAPVRPESRATIPAVTHVDETARLQTVAADGDPLLRAVLEAFAGRTGVPVLLNTSLNGRDEPIVETADEAVGLFLRRPIHHLAMPPFWISKLGSTPHPLRC